MVTTYTIKLQFGGEVEVMTEADLAKFVAQKIKDGQDPQEIIGFVCVVPYDQELYGITSNIYGIQSAFGDGAHITEWWEEEWNEKGFAMWDENCRLVIEY